MEIFLSVFDIFINIVEYTLIFLLFMLTLGCKKGRYLVTCLVGVGLFVMLTLLNKIAVLPYVTAVICGVLDTLYAVFFFDGTRTKSIVIGIAPSLVFWFSEYITFNYFNLVSPVAGDPVLMLEPSVFRLEAQILYTFINIVLFAILIILFRKSGIGILSKKMSLFMLAMIIPNIFIISMLINFSLYTSSNGDHKATLLCAVSSGILFVVTIGVYVLFTAVSRIYEGYLDQRQEVQKLQLERQHHEDMRDAYERLRMWKHDSLNRLQTAGQMIKTGDGSNALDFIEQSVGEIESLQTLVNTEHPVVDAVLSNEFAKANRAGITLSHIIVLTKELPIDDLDLCSLISNLLDNAIEAVQKLPEKDRYIDFEISIKSHNMLISVINPSNGNYKLKQEHTFFTTKKNASEHGIGLKIVTSIVKKYRGILDITPSDGKFEVTIAIPLTEVKAS